MENLKLDSYAMSERIYKILMKKFPAYVTAQLSERAKKEGALSSGSDNNGWCYTSNAAENSDEGVMQIGFYGKYDEFYSFDNDAGMRGGAHIIYNPDSDIVKNCVLESKTANVFNEISLILNSADKTKEVTSEAPIVTFGKKKYIWINKEKCEAGTSIAMEIVNLDMPAKINSDESYKTIGDYAKATKWHKQQDELLKENCTKEELAMIIPVEMSKEDNYNDVTPIFKTKEQLDWFYKISLEPGKFLEMPTGMFKDEKVVTELLNVAKKGLEKEVDDLPDIPLEYFKVMSEYLEEFDKKINNSKKQLTENTTNKDNFETNKVATKELSDDGEGK